MDVFCYYGNLEIPHLNIMNQLSFIVQLNEGFISVIPKLYKIV